VITRPTDCIPFTNCSIQVAKLPVRIFEQPDQQRKKHHSAEKRYTLLVKLSAYADADGGNCYPGDGELIKVLGWSRSHIVRVRGELEASNFVLADGFVRRPGSRTPKAKKWRLVLPPEAQAALGILELPPQPEAPQPEAAST